jgi:toxin ParE1/3/4
VRRYSVEWAVTARDDLEAIAAYIAADSPINALKVVVRIEARADILSSLPMRGRVVPGLRWHGVISFQDGVRTQHAVAFSVREEFAAIQGRQITG